MNNTLNNNNKEDSLRLTHLAASNVRGKLGKPSARGKPMLGGNPARYARGGNPARFAGRERLLAGRPACCEEAVRGGLAASL